MIAANIMDTGSARLCADDAALDALRLVVRGASPYIPVLGPGDAVAGLVTPASLMRAMGGATALGPFREAIGGLCAMRAGEVMDRDYEAIGPEAPASEVAMRFAPPASAPVVLVVDDDSRLLGLITPGDLFGRLCRYAEMRGGGEE